jgi:hypothetical protein
VRGSRSFCWRGEKGEALAAAVMDLDSRSALKRSHFLGGKMLENVLEKGESDDQI